MKIKGIKLVTWLKHPFKCWQSLQYRKYPIVNLDDRRKNCKVCGYDHNYKTVDNQDKYCSKVKS